MISIREVAKMAGVSPATVSRVMNGTAKVNAEKRNRVLRVIEETGFKPNEAARALYRRSARIIGIIVPNIDNPFFNEMAKAIEEEAYQNDYRLTLCNSDNDAKKELHNIELLKRMNADGIILLTNEEQLFHKVKELRIPVVVMDREVTDFQDFIYIEADHYEGGRISAQLLFERGCKKVVHMRGPGNLSSSRKRFDGYLDICQKYHITPHYIDCGYHYEDGLQAATQILEKFPDVDGIVASNDMVALAVYKTLVQNKKQVPKDIQLVGFDNIKLSEIVTPELTTVEQPIDAMGRQAVRSLIDRINRTETKTNHTFPVRIIERETTKSCSESHYSNR